MSSQTPPLAIRAEAPRFKFKLPGKFLFWGAIALVAGVFAWQGIWEHGNPDPTVQGTGRTSAIFDIGVLVFREGLECILVLSAITASMVGTDSAHRRPVAVGAGVGFLATIITWFIAVGIVNDLSDSVPALKLQAATGMLAVVVLLVVMNWFFHKVYWGGWISMHNRKKRELLDEPPQCAGCRVRLLSGLGMLGFTSLYREGFEVVLFLQSYRLKFGAEIVLLGTLIGLALTGIVAALNFIAHRKLPYRRMLVLTGIMLGVVLIVMVGEQAQEMQLAGWLSTHTIRGLADKIPDWAGLWFSIFPTWETLAFQLVAALLVIGSYFVAGRLRGSAAS